MTGQRIITVSLRFVAPRTRRLGPIVDVADISKDRWVLNAQGCAFRAAVTQLTLVTRGVGLGCVPVARRSALRSRFTSFHPMLTPVLSAITAQFSRL